MNPRAQTMKLPNGNGFRPKDAHRKPKPKPKAWSHQNDLTAAKGKQIQIHTHEGMVNGTLLDADQFTIKVRTTLNDGDYLAAQKDQSIVTYFKSALTGFTIKD